MLAHEGERIGKGRPRFAIPSRLPNRKRVAIQQVMSKNGNARKQAQQGRSGAHNRQIRPLALRLSPQMVTHFMKGDFNGTITNDKFCMIRRGRLHLSHHHLPLRLRRHFPMHQLGYPPKKPLSDGGTNEETSMEASPSVCNASQCSLSLGSGLPESVAMNPSSCFGTGLQTCCPSSAHTGEMR